MDEPKQLFQSAKDFEKQKQEQIAKEIIDIQIKILSAIYDKAIAYTHVIIIAGYAGFFGIWSFTKQYLSVGYVLWSALFMSFSIATFVLFEVYKMYVTGRDLLSRNQMVNKQLRDTTDPKAMLTILQEYDKRNEDITIRFGRVWYWNIIIAVITAIVAIFIALFGFVCALLKLYL
jgi:uncharacterized membrane protein